jgi:dGTP triphosphohydrolase
MDNDDRAAARDEIRQVAHDVRDGVRETLAETRDEADVEAADEETETGDTRGVSIERNGEGATRITIGAGE